MARLRSRLIIGCVGLLLFCAGKPVLAISPTGIMVYGDGVSAPLFLRPSGPSEFGAFGLLWWRAGRYDVPHTLAGNPLVAGLGSRAYLKLAIFWGPYSDKPEDASQHGRFYLPTASEPAVVVVTEPRMVSPGGGLPAFPIPNDLTGFNAAWTLSSQDLEIIQGFGIPIKSAARR